MPEKCLKLWVYKFLLQLKIEEYLLWQCIFKFLAGNPKVLHWLTQGVQISRTSPIILVLLTALLIFLHAHVLKIK